MKAESKTTDSSADRRLGPLASLVRAAEPLEELTEAERERIRHRLRRAVLFSHRPAAAFRWSTVLAALGLLLAGGAVFAAAGHFGLIPWPRETKSRSESETAASPARRRPVRAVRPKSTAVSPPTGTVSEAGAPPVQPAIAPAAISPPPMAKPALAPPFSAPVAALAGPRLAMVVPAPAKQVARAVRAFHVVPAVAPAATPNRQAVRGEALHSPPGSAIAPVAIALPPVAAPAVASPSPEPVAPAASPRLAMLDSAASPARASRITQAMAPAPKANGQAMLGQALRSLRSDHDPLAALDALARHAALFPHSSLASERSALEVEALLALGRRDEALARLDGMALDNTPRSAERHVVRGELRARAQRWREAAADFDQALAHASGTSAWQERALWGRAAARMHDGDSTGARADWRLYLQTYPAGRFASEAARLLEAAR